MQNYATKSYGRNDVVAEIYKMFNANRDVSMPGPRRLGKTFVLDRLVDAAADQGWVAVKVEVAGCSETRAFFREMCSKIGGKRTGGTNAIAWIRQHIGQVLDPSSDNSGPWYQALLSLDHESYFARMIKAMNDDKDRRWVLLIDELPIFLKALHDKGPHGVDAARNFMNTTSRLREDNPRVRWMITGSIGLEPLARAGKYMGVLAKFQTCELEPLSPTQGQDLVQDLARTGHLMHRQAITDAEAQALVDAVGWHAAFYLEALAQKLSGEPSDDAEQARFLVEEAVGRLLQPTESTAFGTWEEHLRKHYQDAERRIAFSVLSALAPNPNGLSVDVLLASIRQPELTRDNLRALLTRLHVEGFVTLTEWDGENPTLAFRNPLLRRWWQRHKPQPTA